MLKTDEKFINLDNIHKNYGEKAVLENIDLTFSRGEFIAIVGKSGCGKSTLLRMIAGLEQPTEGTIFQNEKPVVSINKEARIMFQDGRLLPWKTVLDNVLLGLDKQNKSIALELLESVGLTEYASNFPDILSGGQKQRLALARALIHNPELLLLDEPLGALDALTRLDMQKLIENIWQANQFTALLVTHDVEEAVRLADRVLVIKNHTIQSEIEIDLARPRKKSDPFYIEAVEEILQEILDTSTEAESKVFSFEK